MSGKDLIQDALARGQKALTEYQSKQLLAGYGLPVTREVLAASLDQAVEAAESLGFPVALKASSPELMHKSEGGYVKLDLRTADEVRDAYQRLTESAPDLDGVLVQEMAGGRRELVLGMTRDPQFGPVVMVGLGGVLTEVFEDTAFRMAPLDRAEALDMFEELKCRKMLGAFRGDRAADLEAAAEAVIGIGRAALENPEIAEVDVNPLIIGPDGGLKAADALVVLKGAA